MRNIYDFHSNLNNISEIIEKYNSSHVEFYFFDNKIFFNFKSIFSVTHFVYLYKLYALRLIVYTFRTFHYDIITIIGKNSIR